MSLPAVAAPAVAPAPAMAPETLHAQNLFEQLAQRAAAAPSPDAQLGERLLQRLDGFLDRSHAFASQANAGEQVPAAAPQASPRQQPAADVGQLVGNLSRLFDYAIETQMVVRGATQVSGSANTLMRGQ
ncbi:MULTISPECIES: hypothetical protein [Pseudomonadaceae]|uniref:Uncharacterized protein n=2 Tax=Pseudomonadaceae TaxID=135621 RepID=A0A3D9EB14_ECTOL|nr:MULTISPECIES: hypothetical protein [Pseudomonas]RED00364.1 hypothetical protein DFO60_4518 [Pseudomonas oleovorans]